VQNLRRYIAIVLISLLCGCAAMFVPVTNDPREKLQWAIELFGPQMRPLPAERLINEAIVICTKNNDRDCLIQAYKTYGFFFESQSIERWEKVYREQGYQDKTATYDTRFTKAKEYFEKAIPICTELEQFDSLATIYLHLGYTYGRLHDKPGACGSYAKSLENYRKELERNPSAHVNLLRGNTKYEDYVADQQKSAGCKD
jgi:tetratricopeptide (TPR) repeat protein